MRDSNVVRPGGVPLEVLARRGTPSLGSSGIGQGPWAPLRRLLVKLDPASVRLETAPRTRVAALPTRHAAPRLACVYKQPQYTCWRGTVGVLKLPWRTLQCGMGAS